MKMKIGNYQSFQYLGELVKKEKLKKAKRIIENIVKYKIKFTMEYNQDEIVFLYTKIVATPIADEKVVITTGMYSEEKDTHQYLSPNSCHSKNQTKIYLLEWLSE